MEVNLDEVSVEAELHISLKKNSPFFLLSHPHPVYGGSMTNKVIDQFFKRSTERDYSVLRYNMRGVGQSTGSFDHGEGEERDLESLVGWVFKQDIGFSQIVLLGYSFGSWLTAKVVSKLHHPCVLIAPPISLYPFPVLQSSKYKIFFSAPDDRFTPQDKMQEYVDSVSEPKKHIVIPGADHYFIGTTTELIRTVFQTLDQIHF